MAGEPSPSPVPDSSFPLLLSPLSPRRQGGQQVTVAAGSRAAVIRSSVGATGSALGGSTAGGVFTFMASMASSSLFPAAPPLGSAACDLYAAAGAPSSLFPAASPLSSAIGGLDDAVRALSSPFGGLAATRAPSFLVLPLMAGLSADAAGASSSFPAAPSPMVATPMAEFGPGLAVAGWPATTTGWYATSWVVLSLTTLLFPLPLPP
ncbi:hypothetical protein GUJ93_ZPchr0014g46726 [Zizania palustris]|uniref:Uncharacterized protein n=1 Tax=Zizania palustris TaxID=103762 RepID=A0A8J5TEH1_ZIZPA|nr:hypothetical protein GUJ93_ZPchr0014g46726 [Zizania palustris]